MVPQCGSVAITGTTKKHGQLALIPNLGELSMPDSCYTYNCSNLAEDEYHWFEYAPALGYEYEVVWELCEECCAFAVSVVESISELDNEQERELWTTGE